MALPDLVWAMHNPGLQQVLVCVFHPVVDGVAQVPVLWGSFIHVEIREGKGWMLMWV